MNKFKKYSMIPMIAAAVLLTGCEKEEDEVPEEEHDHEMFTDVKLIFTNKSDNSDVVTALAKDPDHEGPIGLKVNESIDLDTNKTYELSFEILNIHDDGDVDDIGAEVKDEADEHQIFFSFTDNAFSNPLGDGNIDNTADPIVYKDQDKNGNPLGLLTEWTTSSSILTNGKFTVRLQHQPDVKTSTSGANDGDSDFDLEFTLNIK